MRSLVQGIMGAFIFQKEICAFRSLDQLLEIKVTLYIEKQRHHFANKGLHSKSYGFFQWSCMDMRLGPQRRLITKKLMHLNYGAGEDS